jgi:NADH-quinone oxidoreductase subunit L
MTHAFFKACLFLGAGSVIHGMSGEQDIQRMGALKKAMPVTTFTFLIAGLALAGVPPFTGFFSKDEILWQAFQHGHKVLWGIGLAAAACTSFYIFRLIFLTFFGESHVSEQAKHHLHESPFSMTSVLIILAVLSLLGGLVGIPHVLGGHNLIHAWLGLEGGHAAPSDERMELISMGISVAIALAGIFSAWLFYLKKPALAAGLARGLRGLHQLLSNKFYVDEIYDALIVRPILRLSQGFLAGVVDEKIVDGALVNGSGRTVAWLGSLVSRLQGGLVNSYALYFLLAICGVLIATVVW